MSVRASMPLGQDGYRVTVKGHAMGRDPGVAAGLRLGAGGRGRLGQRLIVLILVAAVIVLDQAAKWWAWRHASGAEINAGGDLLVGPTVSRWYANPVAGALLDLLDVGVLSLAVATLVRRRRPAVVVVPGALMLGGWASNLLDRLGMHYWTAPGSVRGVVDFISAAGSTYNVADCFIVGATPLLVLAAGALKWRARNRPGHRQGRGTGHTQAPAGAGTDPGAGRRGRHRDRRRDWRRQLRRGEHCPRARQRTGNVAEQTIY